MAKKSSQTPLTQASRFGAIQDEGAQRRRWIADSNEPGCYIGRSTLTFSHLVDRYEGLTAEPVDPDTYFEEHYQNFELNSHLLNWSGCTGPGMIIIDVMTRAQLGPKVTFKLRANVPTASAVAQAFYERDFDLNDLRCVFVNGIINKNTVGFIREHIYNPEDFDNFPGLDFAPQTWKYASPEYDGLLGTRIGKVVAYLVLGAFERGTRRISQIVTYSYEGIRAVHMRFDIEVV
ncbi:hypothetical protein N7486_009859 [Penicillium sp. IBT 16267x]|nr:hypothetical protein N7486_009859 [Penicillium sp. IBT 16267x]